jgi:hypothetical protein
MAKTPKLKRLTAKKLDLLIESLYRKNCSGITIPMLEIPAIFRAAKTAYDEGFVGAETNVAAGVPLADVEAALVTAVKDAIVAKVAAIRVN